MPNSPRRYVKGIWHPFFIWRIKRFKICITFDIQRMTWLPIFRQTQAIHIVSTSKQLYNLVISAKQRSPVTPTKNNG